MGVYAFSMSSFEQLLQHGAASAWLFLPTAVVLGALHGLEPGHSKTMMAAFIVSIRGTVGQALLLGLSATVSHTAIIWILAYAGLRYAAQIDVEKTEPYFQLASGVIILALAAWTLVRTRRELREEAAHHHDHDHAHPHDDHHGEHEHTPEYLDAHARAHAADLERRFAGRTVTTPQIVLFGLTGGLLPCPAAFSVLLVCLQLKRYTLGFATVLAFSVGLAITLVSAGAVAAVSVRQAGKRFKGFDRMLGGLPYLSVGVMTAIGVFIAVSGARGILR